MIGSPKILARLLHDATHNPRTAILKIVPGGPGRNTYILEASVEEAIERLLEGYEPPLFPSEMKCRQCNAVA